MMRLGYAVYGIRMGRLSAGVDSGDGYGCVELTMSHLATISFSPFEFYDIDFLTFFVFDDFCGDGCPFDVGCSEGCLPFAIAHHKYAIEGDVSPGIGGFEVEIKTIPFVYFNLRSTVFDDGVHDDPLYQALSIRIMLRMVCSIAA